MMRNFWPDFSWDRSRQRAILKDTDISDTSAMTVLWRSFASFVVPNWFCCTDAVKGGTRRFLSVSDTPLRNFSSMTE